MISFSKTGLTLNRLLSLVLEERFIMLVEVVDLRRFISSSTILLECSI